MAFNIKLIKRWLLALACTSLLLACGLAQPSPAAEPAPAATKLEYIATAPPLGMILREVAGTRATVRTLLPPGASPHTYEPKPSEVRAIAQAAGFFYGGELLDGWAVDLGGSHAIDMFALVPAELKLEMPAHSHAHHHDSAQEHHSAEHEHEEEDEHGHSAGPVPDPHFWTSPRVVRALLPALVAKLAELDPAGAEEYRANAWLFGAALGELDRELAGTLASVRGEHLLLFHPSFLYLMHDYGLELAGVVEPVPGQEPSPQLIAALIKLSREQKLKAVFTEPQLPAAPAQAIARELKLPLFELDPLGGGTGRQTYAGLLRCNARVLAEALKH